MKIRNGFVSNSSSSSFIVIATPINNDYLLSIGKNFKGTVLVVDRNFGETEFGWQNDKYDDVGSKIIFAYLQAEYLVNLNSNDYFISKEDADKGNEKGKRWLTMLDKVIKDNLKVIDIEWNITTEYGEKAKGKDRAYIDHQSASVEDKNIEIFESEEILTNFLFNENSYIQTGNDNED